MNRSSAALLLVIVWCANPVSSFAGNEDSRQAIERGAACLARDAVAWREKYKCSSCHHAALVAWALHDAQQAGFPIDEAVLNDMNELLAAAGTGKTSLPRPEGVPKAVNTKPIYFAMGLGAQSQNDEATLERIDLLLSTVKEDQFEDGRWSAWPETRPPIFSDSDEIASAQAVLSLLPLTKRDPTAAAAVEKGMQWLAGIESNADPQALALRVMIWTQRDKPAEEWQPWVKQIAGNQRDDGGWSQGPNLPSDAWATGQALYALALAGYSAEDDVIARGREFLIRTQRDDGSWPMTSRSLKPDGPGGTSLVPITGAGSAWGLIGLVRTEPKS